MAEEKIYVGKGVEKFDGDQIAISVNLTDLPKEFKFEYDKKEYIKLIVQKRREKDQYGKTHYVAIDQWKPEKKEEKCNFY